MGGDLFTKDIQLKWLTQEDREILTCQIQTVSGDSSIYTYTLSCGPGLTAWHMRSLNHGWGEVIQVVLNSGSDSSLGPLHVKTKQT